MRVLKDRKDFTVDKLIGAAFDPRCRPSTTSFRRSCATTMRSPSADPRKAALAEPIDSLRRWNHQWGAASVPTSLADYWGNAAMRAVGRAARAKGISALEYITQGATAEERLDALTQAVGTLTRDFGTLEEAVGRDQSLPAPQRRYRRPVR